MKLSSIQLDVLVNSVREQEHLKYNAKTEALEKSEKIIRMRKQVIKKANKAKKLIDELYAQYGEVFHSGWQGLPAAIRETTPKELRLLPSFYQKSNILPPATTEEIRNKIILATIDATDLKNLSRITGFKF